VYPVQLYRIGHGQGLKNSNKRMPKRSHDVCDGDGGGDGDDGDDRRGNGREERKKERSNF
jgi:hypothetical protein